MKSHLSTLSIPGNKPIVNDDGNQTGVADAATKPTEKSVKITETAAKAAQTEL